MEFVEQCAEDGQVSDSSLVENEEDEIFLDDLTQIESQPSDYFGLRNVESSVSSAEEDVFSHSDVAYFIDFDVEARKYVHPGFDAEEGDLEVYEFENFKTRMQKINPFVLSAPFLYLLKTS